MSKHNKNHNKSANETTKDNLYKYLRENNVDKVKNILEQIGIGAFINPKDAFITSVKDGVTNPAHQHEILTIALQKVSDFRLKITNPNSTKAKNAVSACNNFNQKCTASLEKIKEKMNAEEPAKQDKVIIPETKANKDKEPSIDTNKPAKLADTTDQITPIEEEVKLEAKASEALEIAKSAITALSQGKIAAFKKVVNNNHITQFANPAIQDTVLTTLNNSTKDNDKEEVLSTFISQLSTIEEQNDSTKLFTVKCLNEKAKLIFTQFAGEEEAIRKVNYEKAIGLLDEANVICVQNQSGEDFKSLSDSILLDITTHISQYPHKQDAYELAKSSLSTRKEKAIEENSQTMLQAYTVAAQAGMGVVSTDNTKVATEIYNFCLKALNICTELKSSTQKAQLYNCMGNLHNEILDDVKKASALLKLAASNENDNCNFKPIIKFGSITENELKIKKAIQKDILDNVYQAAAEGKWINIDWKGSNQGISGYLADDYIRKHLPEDLQDETHINTALKLCFEAINLGIMNSANKNPLCSAIFAQEYPQIIGKMKEEHPEFFVDEFILKTSLPDAHLISEELTGTMIEENGVYNKHFEKAILPFVHKRLDESVFNPIKQLITAKNWNESAKNELKKYLSEEYLTDKGIGITNSHLGENLKMINDIFNIIRIEAFKNVVDSLRQNNDGNYAPLNTFFTVIQQGGKHIFDRIEINHKDYFNSQQISNMFNKFYDTVNDSSKPAAQPEMLQSMFLNNVENPSITESSLSGDVVDESSGAS